MACRQCVRSVPLLCFQKEPRGSGGAGRGAGGWGDCGCAHFLLSLLALPPLPGLFLSLSSLCICDLSPLGGLSSQEGQVLREDCSHQLRRGDQEAWEASISISVAGRHCWCGPGWNRSCDGCARGCWLVFKLGEQSCPKPGVPLGFTSVSRILSHQGHRLMV